MIYNITYNLVRCNICQNFQTFQKLQKCTIAYQFKVKRPVYYPDRQIEMQRINEQMKSQLVAEAKEKKKLPKDYYYRVLGVSKYATTQQIKSTYYTLAKRFHPDASHTSHESKRFQEISNAYHILTDDTKRLEYDQLGVVKDEQSFLNKITNPTVAPNPALPTTKEELLKMNKIEPRLEVTFVEAAHGLKKNAELRYLKKCPACNGKAPKLSIRTEPELCRACNGTGKITKKTSTYTNVTDCDQCHGKRYLNRSKCEICDNRGIVLESVKVVVAVPAGTKTGDVIVIENPKTKQPVNYRINVHESDYFHRIGNNLYTDKYLTISEAVLGGLHKVRGIHGEIEVKIEPGTESHTKVVLKGKGIKTQSVVGDHIVTFKIRIPRQLSMKQRQLILALSKAEEPTFERPI